MILEQIMILAIFTLVATYDCDRYRDCLAKRNIVAFDLFEYVHLNRELQLGLPKMIKFELRLESQGDGPVLKHRLH